jgi:hypothetical protein
MHNYHLVHRQGEWKLEGECARRATVAFHDCSKRDAIRQCAERFNHGKEPVSLKIHKLNGRIQEERSYPHGHDPRRSRG